MPKFIKLDGELENVELVCSKADGTKYDFNRFSLPLKFIRKTHNYEITLNEATEKQAKLKNLLNKLSNYGPRKLDARDDIIDFFKKGIFPYKDNVFKKEEIDKNEFFKYIENKSKGINYELFEKHFNNVVPNVLAKTLFETKDKNKNNIFVIRSGLRDLKNKIKKMSKEEIEIGKPDKMLEIVEEIFEFNKKIQKNDRIWIKNTNTKPNA